MARRIFFSVFVLIISMFLIFNSCINEGTDDNTDNDNDGDSNDETLPPSWQSIIDEDFEGTFPVDKYYLYDNDGTVNGEYFWALSPDQAYSGSKSLWAIGGGAEGSQLPALSNYPDNCVSWFVFGPYNFSKATDIRGSFYCWLNSQPDADYLKFGYSYNGTDFYLAPISGLYGEWIYEDMYLGSNAGLFIGQPQVYFGFFFQSGAETNYQGGAYIDDVLIEIYQ